MLLGRPLLESLRAAAAGIQGARRATDELFALVRPEALLERPIPERHRLLFYLGHLEAFDANLLFEPLGLAPLRPGFDRLFAFGIDPVGGALPDEPASAWPRAAEVLAYGRGVREAIDARLAALAEHEPQRELEERLHIAIEHRWMHAETLAYLLQRLAPEHKLAPRVHDRPPPGPAVAPHRVTVPAGRATLGKPRDGAFGWDNELDEHTVGVPAFEIDALQITNAQFLDFVRSGGYASRRHWSEADWKWRERAQLEHPASWVRDGGGFRYRGTFAERALALDEPAYVSHAEAAAFAHWAGRVLPSEAQFHRAAYGTPGGSERAYPWGEEPPTSERGNFAGQRFEPAPCGAYPAGESAFGVRDLLGNGWEWTRTLFAPFRGFAASAAYPGYSADFFDGRHYVLKGGGPRTAARLLRRSFRNWFQPHYPYAHAGFRTVDA